MGCCSDGEKPPRVVGADAGKFHCTDILFVLLFIANLVPLFYFFNAFTQDNDIYEHLNSTLGRIVQEEFENDMNVAAAAGGYACLGTLVLVIVWLGLCYFMATLLIILAQLLLIASCAISGVVLLTNPSDTLGDDGSTAVGVLLLVFAALLVLWLICIRDRIAFTAAMLSEVAKIIVKAPELLLIKALFSGLVLGFTMIWAGAYVEMLAQIDEYEADNDTDAYHYWVIGNLWMVLSVFWVQFTLLNICTVTTCATVGSWYFSPDTIDRGTFCMRPPVWWGLLRSCTFSFGSISFGSLVMAIMRTIIVAVQYLANKAEESGGTVAKVICCCFICCLKCIESILEWLTEYAFVYVALYGINFCSAGSQVFKLLSESGAKAIIQQSLLSPLGYMAGGLGLVVGALCGWGAHEQQGYDDLSDNARRLQLSVALISGALVGYLSMVLGVSTTLDAGCKTLLVCYAEDPSHLKEVNSELYEKFTSSNTRAPTKWSTSLSRAPLSRYSPSHIFWDSCTPRLRARSSARSRRSSSIRSSRRAASPWRCTSSTDVGSCSIGCGW